MTPRWLSNKHKAPKQSMVFSVYPLLQQRVDKNEPFILAQRPYIATTETIKIKLKDINTTNTNG